MQKACWEDDAGKKAGSAEKVSNEIPMLPRRVPQIFFKLLNVSYGDRSDGLRHL